jgi:hypothetical protein
MARPKLERPKHGWVDFTCPLCGFDWTPDQAVYHPRDPKRARRVICRTCGVRLAGMFRRTPPTTQPLSAWSQTELHTVSQENGGETDSHPTSQKAG